MIRGAQSVEARRGAYERWHPSSCCGPAAARPLRRLQAPGQRDVSDTLMTRREGSIAGVGGHPFLPALPASW